MLGFILHLVKIMPISHDLIYSNIDALALIGAGTQIATGGIPGLFKGITGLATSAFGKKAKDLPQYKIPEAAIKASEENLRFAGEIERMGLPESTKRDAEQRAQQAAIFGMRAAGDIRSRQALVGNVQAGLDRTNLNLTLQDADRRQRNMMLGNQARISGLLTRAQYEDKAFANQWQSAANELQQERARIGAIEQNAARNIDTASAIALSFAGGGFGGLAGGAKSGGLGAGSMPGIGGSTYNPSTSLLSGSVSPVFRGAYTPSAASMSLTGMRSPFSSFSIMNANIPSSNTQSNYTPTANLPGYGAAMQDLFSQPIGY